MEVHSLALTTQHVIITLWNGCSEPWRELVDPAVLGADAGQRLDVGDIVWRQHPSALR